MKAKGLSLDFILEDNKVKSTTSIAQIAEAEGFFNDAEKVNAAKEKSSFDADDFFKAALERSELVYGKEVKK